MKTYKTVIVILSAFFLFSCGTNKQKTPEAADQVDEFRIVDIEEAPMQAENNIVSEDISEDKKALYFVPPTISADEE